MKGAAPVPYLIALAAGISIGVAATVIAAACRAARSDDEFDADRAYYRGVIARQADTIRRLHNERAESARRFALLSDAMCIAIAEPPAAPAEAYRIGQDVRERLSAN